MSLVLYEAGQLLNVVVVVVVLAKSLDYRERERESEIGLGNTNPNRKSEAGDTQYARWKQGRKGECSVYENAEDLYFSSSRYTSVVCAFPVSLCVSVYVCISVYEYVCVRVCK